MDTRIFGGRRNRAAIVSEAGRLHTLAVSHTPQFHHALREEAYFALTEVDLTDGTLTPVAWLRNDDQSTPNGDPRLLIVDSIEVSADANIRIEAFVDEGYTSGGTDRVPVNAHRGSSMAAQATIKDASGAALVLDSTGTKIVDVFVGSYATSKHTCDLLLPKSGTMSLKAQGAAGNKVRIGLSFYYVVLSSD